MKKLFICLLLTLFATTGLNAEVQENLALKAAMEHINKIMKSYDAQRVNLAISGSTAEEWGELFQVSLDFDYCGSKNILPIIDELGRLDDDMARIEVNSYKTFLSAEIRYEDRQPYITANMQVSIATGNVGDKTVFSNQLAESVFSMLDFSPGIARNGLIENIDIWLTSLRLDRNEQMQINGYSKNFAEISTLAAKLAEMHPDQDVKINSLEVKSFFETNTFFFTIAANTSSVKISENFNQIFDQVYAITSAANATLESMSVQPGLMINSFSMPMKIRIGQIPDLQAEAIKAAILDLEFAGLEVKAGDEIAIIDNLLEMEIYVWQK